MNLELANKVVLVTGGSDGLGAAACVRLAEEGARVAFCGRDAERLERTRAAVKAAGGEGLAVRADITRAEDCERFLAESVRAFGRVDALVNNAGTAAARPFESVDDAAWAADLDLKLMAAVRLIRGALPHLRAAGGGSILNVLAMAAKAPGARSAPSSVSRAAGMALTKALSKELGPEGIRVNAVLIGLVESGQWERKAKAAGQSVEALYGQLARDSGIPLGRVGRTAEFADLVAFLLSPRAAYLSGTAINLDGGLSSAV
ncbi:SDR family oxidoreductase [Aggregicoccus sp. 17bor-14]|uniref:SDR family NAD(P)-dependent oxidoreductase n=1 Tax=Myxococcaceae TaxID=31 RepID=UPI00129C21EB|nr:MULTISPECIES: SDR family oxidoreductase [Myxococcaceae]MBF5045419.1 SDR family oxidoreductase [Simulacricoccus sp. 17bor-14]MRI91160.1 SDR family oxidoreductase [Aggregicoccus sp. 17bor-14]